MEQKRQRSQEEAIMRYNQEQESTLREALGDEVFEMLEHLEVERNAPAHRENPDSPG